MAGEKSRGNRREARCPLNFSVAVHPRCFDHLDIGNGQSGVERRRRPQGARIVVEDQIKIIKLAEKREVIRRVAVPHDARIRIKLY
jgi:hypothetical protein